MTRQRVHNLTPPPPGADDGREAAGWGADQAPPAEAASRLPARSRDVRHGPGNRRIAIGAGPAEEAMKIVVVGYVRVSTDRQENGPDAQRAAIEAWCKAKGAELLAVHEDINSCGASSLESRPGLSAALAALPRGAALLAAKRDRIGRDVVLVALVERLVERRGAQLLTCDGAGEGTSPEAGLMRRIIDSFGEYERLLIGSRTTAALALKRSRGERTGTVAYGMRLCADGVHVEADQAEQSVLVRIRELRADGLSLRRAAQTLNDEGLRLRSGGRWSHHDVRRVLAPDVNRAEQRRHRARRRQGRAA